MLRKSSDLELPAINPREYLTDVLTRLPGMLAKDAITLTPTNSLKGR